MNQISLFLKKYENLGFKEFDLKRKIIEVVKDEIGLELKQDDIKINEKEVRINTSGAAKSELLLKKRIIEEKINEIKLI